MCCCMAHAIDRVAGRSRRATGGSDLANALYPPPTPGQPRPTTLRTCDRIGTLMRNARPHFPGPDHRRGGCRTGQWTLHSQKSTHQRPRTRSGEMGDCSETCAESEEGTGNVDPTSVRSRRSVRIRLEEHFYSNACHIYGSKQLYLRDNSGAPCPKTKTY